MNTLTIILGIYVAIDILAAIVLLILNRVRGHNLLTMALAFRTYFSKPSSIYYADDEDYDEEDW